MKTTFNTKPDSMSGQSRQAWYCQVDTCQVDTCQVDISHRCGLAFGNVGRTF